MMQMIKSRLDQFLGRGHAAVTVPSLDGALKPNNRLEEAAEGISGDAPDNLVLFNGQPVWSEGALIFSGRDKTLLVQMKSDVTAMAVSTAGDLAVALLEGGIQMLDVKGELKKSFTAPELSCVTSMVFVAPETLVVAVGSTVNPITDWARDLLEQRSSGQIVVLDTISGHLNVIAKNLAFPSGLLRAADGSLIVSEAWACQLLQIDLSSGQKISVMEDLSPTRLTSTRIVRMLTSSTLCRNGNARQPPVKKIPCPP